MKSGKSIAFVGSMTVFPLQFVVGASPVISEKEIAKMMILALSASCSGLAVTVGPIALTSGAIASVGRRAATET